MAKTECESTDEGASIERPALYLSPEDAIAGRPGYIIEPPNLPRAVIDRFARVLCRVPPTESRMLSGRVVLVLVDPKCAHYLMPPLTRGRAVIYLGAETVMARDEALAEVLLPALALVLMGDVLQSDPPPMVQSGHWLDVATREVTDRREHAQVVKDHRNAQIDLEIDVHFARQQAEKVGRDWSERWRESHRA